MVKDYTKFKRLSAWRRSGIVKSLVAIKHLIEYCYLKAIPQRHFIYKTKKYPFFIHMYNATWTAERKIEVPIFKELVENTSGKILEVGCVLPHYIKIKHKVIDKYEEYPSCQKIDVIDYKPEEKYNLIISISTLEHVGKDEEIQDALKPRKSLIHLKSMLAPNGNLIISYPEDYNPNLNKAVSEIGMKVTKMKTSSWGMTDRKAIRIFCIAELNRSASSK